MTYRLLTKQGNDTIELKAGDDWLQLEQLYQTFLQYSEHEDWKITTLNNGKTQLRRGKEVMQIWIGDDQGKVVK